VTESGPHVAVGARGEAAPGRSGSAGAEMKIDEEITALPWQEIPEFVAGAG
jgi:hypothetical protein